MEQNNPLRNFFRQFKFYQQLPSGNSYYSPDDVALTSNNEVGILAMTGSDELILKNPDALLNGEALIEVIKSCVPAVKNPRVLLSNDIDAIITAIRHATYGSELESTLNCPSCGAENIFALDLQYALDNMTFLESEYVVNLDSGLSVFVRPFIFPEMLRSLHAQFEQAKLSRALQQENITEEEKSAAFKRAFNELAIVSVEMVTASIIRIVNEEHQIDVSDRVFISEFVKNSDRKTIEKIQNVTRDINTIGVKKNFSCTCEKCAHIWESEIDFNPVNFS